MPIHSFERIKGSLIQTEIDSASLKDNLIDDPHVRAVEVYLPPGYSSSKRNYPLFVYLAAFGGSGLKQSNWKQFGESLPQRVERLISERQMGPIVLAMPDCFTSLGGNQYLNSPVTGKWEDYLLAEMVPHLEKNFRIHPEPASRALVGYSSGGYGCLIQGLRHGQSWGAIGCHSADVGFENMFLGVFPRVMTRLAHFDHSVEAFLQHIREVSRIPGSDFETLMMIAMAASYDPTPAEPFGIRFPVHPHTCELIPERWKNWLQNDPLQMVREDSCRDSLRKLRGLYLDCGSNDQYHLQYGARNLSSRLIDYGIEHLYEEHEGDHLGVDHRLDRSLPVLYRALGP